MTSKEKIRKRMSELGFSDDQINNAIENLVGNRLEEDIDQDDLDFFLSFDDPYGLEIAAGIYDKYESIEL